MPKGVPRPLTPEEQTACKALTFEADRRAFNIGFTRWKAIKEASGFLPFRGGNPPSQEVEDRVLDSVRQRPHLALSPRASGKVEALNRVLQYPCFAAIAGNIADWPSACDLVERWMHYYNTQRSHSGHVSKDLPPIPFYELYKQTPATTSASSSSSASSRSTTSGPSASRAPAATFPPKPRTSLGKSPPTAPTTSPPATSSPSPSSRSARKQSLSEPSNPTFPHPASTVTP